jgi:hypothetical protein
MKKIIMVVITILLCICTYTGCSQPEPEETVNTDYEVVVDEQGNWYLKFFDVLPPRDYYALYYQEIQFESVEEMRARIVNHELTKSECYMIMRYITEAPCLIQICNLDNLFILDTYPPNEEVSNVRWYCGTQYAYSLKNKWNGENKRIIFYSEDVFVQKYDAAKEYVQRKDLISEKQLEDRNAIEYVWKNGKCVQYELEKEDKKLFVQERYAVNTETGESEISSVYVLGMQNGAYWCMTTYPAERPSEDWLLSFGVQPFVPEETPAA